MLGHVSTVEASLGQADTHVQLAVKQQRQSQSLILTNRKHTFHMLFLKNFTLLMLTYVFFVSFLSVCLFFLFFFFSFLFGV